MGVFELPLDTHLVDGEEIDAGFKEIKNAILLSPHPSLSETFLTRPPFLLCYGHLVRETGSTGFSLGSISDPF